MDNFSALFIVAHPDDAEIVAGGTISALRLKNVDVTVAVATISEYRTELRPKRRMAAERAANLLDYKLEWIEDGQLDQVEELPEFRWVGLMDKLIRRIKPDLIFSHWPEDGHPGSLLCTQCQSPLRERTGSGDSSLL